MSDTEDDEVESEQNEDDHDDNNYGFHELQYPSSDSADDVDLGAAESENEGDDQLKNLKSGDYVIVQLKGQKNVFHYAARIDKPADDDEDVEITYLERKPAKYDDEERRFVIPEPSKSYPVPQRDIVKKLPQPIVTGGTKRISRQITFPISLMDYNMA